MKRPRGANEIGAPDDRANTEMVKRSQPSQLLRKLRNAQRHRQAQIARPQGDAGNVRLMPSADQQTDVPDALAASQWSRRGVLLALVPLSIVGMVSLFVMGFVGSREIVSFLVGREYVPTTMNTAAQDTPGKVPVAETQEPGIAPELTASSPVPFEPAPNIIAVPATDTAKTPDSETVEAPAPEAVAETDETPAVTFEFEAAETPAPAVEVETAQAPAPAVEVETAQAPAPAVEVETTQAPAPTVEVETAEAPAPTVETNTVSTAPPAVDTEIANVPPQAVEEATPINTAAVDELIPPLQDADVPPALAERTLVAEAEPTQPDAAPKTAPDAPTKIVVTPAEETDPVTAAPPQETQIAETPVVETPVADVPVAEDPVAEIAEEQLAAASQPDAGTIVTPAAAPTPEPKLNIGLEVANAARSEEEEEPLTRRDNDDLSEDLRQQRDALTTPSEEPATATPQVTEPQSVAEPQLTADAPEVAAETPEVAATQQVAALQEPTGAVETTPAAELDPAAEAARLIGEGQSLLASGDVVQARERFSRGLTTGSAEAALALGRSFDPKHLAGIRNPNAAADPVTARKWYEEWYRRSVEQGSISPKVRLDRLLHAMRAN